MPHPDQASRFTIKNYIKAVPFVGPLLTQIVSKMKAQKKAKQRLSTIQQSIQSLAKYMQTVEYYQPLYNVPLFMDKKPQRFCFDRADAIYEKIKPWGAGGRILDVGCSLGYFVHYFGERGYRATGIDYNADNIAVCQLVAIINQMNYSFTTVALSPAFLETIDHHSHDIVFLFSVVHHIIYYQGLDYAQTLMAALLDKIPVLFIELATKHEETDAPWRQHLPENELAIFAKCKDISIENMGSFANHLSSVARPLYCVTKNRISIADHVYQIKNRWFTAYQYAPNFNRQFYDCGDVFIKKYLFTEKAENNNNTKQIFQEIKNYKSLPQNDFFPRLLSDTETDKQVEVVFTKLPGKNLYDLLIQHRPIPRLAVFKNVVAGLHFLLEKGELYHNDVRPWNIMYDDHQSYLLDLGLSAHQETESTCLALLWLISLMHAFYPRQFENPITVSPVINLDSLEPGFIPIVKMLQNVSSFPLFLEWFQRENAHLTLASS